MDTTIKVVSRKFMRSKETALLVSIDNHTWKILKMHFVEDMWMLPLVWDRTKPWRIYIRSTHDKRRWFQVVSVLSFEVVPPGAIHRCGIDYIYIYIYIYIYMVPSQNCVWNVPRCSGRMERRGFVTGLVPDLWSVMKYRLYINKYINK